jgi:hypothetical protein
MNAVSLYNQCQISAICEGSSQLLVEYMNESIGLEVQEKGGKNEPSSSAKKISTEDENYVPGTVHVRVP